MSNLNKMRVAFVAFVSLTPGVLAGCNRSPETASPPPHSEAPVDADEPESLAGLTSIKAETKTGKAGLITFIDVSERDDITDATFQYFSGLPKLRELHAIYTPISGTGLEHIADSKTLETLDLYACPITDESLAKIANLKSLRSLNLIGSKITDDSIETLSRFQNLEYLGIPTQISESGRKRLADTLPDSCELD